MPALQSPTETPPRSSPAWRVIVPVVAGTVLFAMLCYTVFSPMTAALIASGGAVVLVAGANASDSPLDIAARIILGVLATIGAFSAAILAILG
jgi:hypothetical protein